MKIFKNRLFIFFFGLSLGLVISLIFAIAVFYIYDFAKSFDDRRHYTDYHVRYHFRYLNINYSKCSNLFYYEEGFADCNRFYSFDCSPEFAKRWVKFSFNIDLGEPENIISVYPFRNLTLADQKIQHLFQPEKVKFGYFKKIEGKNSTPRYILYDLNNKRMFYNTSSM